MGPLKGVNVIEFAGMGPGPHAAMMLADMGATVLRIERREDTKSGVLVDLQFNTVMRNRSAIALDLKSPEELAMAMQLIAKADALIEGFRPGVMERIGLGPEICLQRNPRLVYCRMTGWGQDGPRAHAADHDINYTAIR